MIEKLMAEVRDTLPEGGDWCTVTKAQTLAALVVGLRPRVIVEIGVWMGGSLLPLLFAARAVRELDGQSPARVVAIDPWSKDDSCAGQAGADAEWWAMVSHEDAYHAFLARLGKHDLSDACEVVRARSDDAAVPERIDLLHVDGNHAAQAIRDVERFAPAVAIGGILVLDDLNWHGGHVRHARDVAGALGFVDSYPLDTGLVMKRVTKENGDRE